MPPRRALHVGDRGTQKLPRQNPRRLRARRRGAGAQTSAFNAHSPSAACSRLTGLSELAAEELTARPADAPAPKGETPKGWCSREHPSSSPPPARRRLAGISESAAKELTARLAGASALPGEAPKGLCSTERPGRELVAVRGQKPPRQTLRAAAEELIRSHGRSLGASRRGAEGLALDRVLRTRAGRRPRHKLASPGSRSRRSWGSSSRSEEAPAPPSEEPRDWRSTERSGRELVFVRDTKSLHQPVSPSQQSRSSKARTA